MEDKRTRTIQTVLIAVLMVVIVALIVAAAFLTARVYITNRSISAVLEETGTLPEFNGDLVDLVDSCFAIYYYTELPAREVYSRELPPSNNVQRGCGCKFYNPNF